MLRNASLLARLVAVELALKMNIRTQTFQQSVPQEESDSLVQVPLCFLFLLQRPFVILVAHDLVILIATRRAAELIQNVLLDYLIATSWLTLPILPLKYLVRLNVGLITAFTIVIMTVVYQEAVQRH